MTHAHSDVSARLPPGLEVAVSHFNGRRYAHADGAWRRATLSMPEAERPFLEGLRLVTWALHYVERRDYRSARSELVAGLARLSSFPPGHLGLSLDEVIDLGMRLLRQLDECRSVYLIPPVIKRARPGAELVADDAPGQDG